VPQALTIQLLEQRFNSSSTKPECAQTATAAVGDASSSRALFGLASFGTRAAFAESNSAAATASRTACFDADQLTHAVMSWVSNTREGGAIYVMITYEASEAAAGTQGDKAGPRTQHIEAAGHVEPPRDWTEMVPLRDGWKRNIEKLERCLVQKALAEAAGNKSRAAEALGIHRRLLYEKLRRYGMNGG
jgi:DNA-binding NtrC family response regulator